MNSRITSSNWIWVTKYGVTSTIIDLPTFAAKISCYMFLSFTKQMPL